MTKQDATASIDAGYERDDAARAFRAPTLGLVVITERVGFVGGGVIERPAKKAFVRLDSLDSGSWVIVVDDEPLPGRERSCPGLVG